MPPPTLVSFGAGDSGPWAIRSTEAVTGAGLPHATRLEALPGDPHPRPQDTWTLRGFTSNDRYVERAERQALTAVQQPLGRPGATCAALIPIRKSAAWWDLTQDDRRAILEEQSHHIAIGLEYLPAVARRLHHSRDLGEDFDFLTWFEFAPDDTPAFEELLVRLRATPEWSWVEREVDIRLVRSI